VAVYSFYVFWERGEWDENISNTNLFHWGTLPNTMYENPAMTQGALTSILPIHIAMVGC
jgi:hypothetical protein